MKLKTAGYGHQAPLSMQWRLQVFGIFRFGAPCFAKHCSTDVISAYSSGSSSNRSGHPLSGNDPSITLAVGVSDLSHYFNSFTIHTPHYQCIIASTPMLNSLQAIVTCVHALYWCPPPHSSTQVQLLRHQRHHVFFTAHWYPPPANTSCHCSSDILLSEPYSRLTVCLCNASFLFSDEYGCYMRYVHFI